jgi:hypothetical protein
MNFRKKTLEAIVVHIIDVSSREQSKKKPYLNAPDLGDNHCNED